MRTAPLTTAARTGGSRTLATPSRYEGAGRSGGSPALPHVIEVSEGESPWQNGLSGPPFTSHFSPPPPWKQAGWFLLAHAREKGDEALAACALRIVDDNFAWGWDAGDDGREGGGSGGLLYFRDVEGYSPTQLEWDM